MEHSHPLDEHKNVDRLLHMAARKGWLWRIKLIFIISNLYTNYFWIRLVFWCVFVFSASYLAVWTALSIGVEVKNTDSMTWEMFFWYLKRAGLSSFLAFVLIGLFEIRKAADPNIKDKYSNTPLHLAADKGHKAVAEVLIDNRADVNAKNKDDETPLHSVVKNPVPNDDIRYSEFFEVLVDQSDPDVLDVNAQDKKKGETPLHYLARNRNYNMMRYLLFVPRIKVDIEGKFKQTPLNLAVCSGCSNCVNLLISKKADVTTPLEGQTMLFHAASRGFEVIVAALIGGLSEKQKVKEYISEAEDEWKLQPIHAAAIARCEKIIELLADKGANVNAKAKDQHTPLHSMFLEYGTGSDTFCDVPLSYVFANTPPFFNCPDPEKKFQSALKVLLDKGANINAETEEGQTPLDFADRLLRKHSKEEEKKPIEEAIQYLENKGARRSIKGIRERYKLDESLKKKYPLHYQVIVGYTGDLKESVKQQDININEKDEDGMTPLYYAAFFGHKEMVEVLIDNRADVNMANAYSETPLHLAAENGHKEVAEVLIDNRADVNAKNKYGETPLHRVAQALLTETTDKEKKKRLSEVIEYLKSKQ